MTGFDVIIDCERWTQSIGDVERLAARVNDAVAAIEPRAAGEAALLLTDDLRVAALNRQFRGKAGPTNVLSFPSGDAASGFLGDIAVAFETCEREAAQSGRRLADHAAHLFAHGLLHLVGHDHIGDEDAEAMEAIEIAALDALGVSNPYEDEEIEA